MSKHTPGPWVRDDDGFISCENEIICDPQCSKDIDIDEREANAQLIAAAPDLLAACQRTVLLSYHADGCRWFKFNVSQLATKEGRAKAQAECDCHLATCLAAIAKATGV